MYETISNEVVTELRKYRKPEHVVIQRQHWSERYALTILAGMLFVFWLGLIGFGLLLRWMLH